jgi:hypothetical protein
MSWPAMQGISLDIEATPSQSDDATDVVVRATSERS